ncbi:MAG: class I SAM-dependent methyltransferase [Nitrososphaeria archaeon]|nr:class I SAM-dependent methyltransferase [Nitrososphaeria archaeon]MDW8021239.1 class I SAM-dependent methyltransferase [Nitrososphaerota archaeon]
MKTCEGKIPFVPSPHDVVQRMLSLADPHPDELLVDLGSGDGRIVIAASRDYRCKSIGVEVDRALIDYSRRKISRLGLLNARIVKGDLHEFDFADADVVTLYLLPKTLEALKPKILKLKRGSRVICHDFKIPGLEPQEVYFLKSGITGRIHRIYYYEVD